MGSGGGRSSARQLASIACVPSPCTLEEGGKRALRAAFKIMHNANEDLMQRNLKHGKKALVGLAPEKVLPPRLLYQPCPVIKGAEAEASSIEVFWQKPDIVLGSKDKIPDVTCAIRVALSPTDGLQEVPAILEVGNIRHHLLDDGRVAKWAAFRAKCLAPGTEYTFQVKATYNKATSTWSEPFCVHTKSLTPVIHSLPQPANIPPAGASICGGANLPIKKGIQSSGATLEAAKTCHGQQEVEKKRAVVSEDSSAADLAPTAAAAETKPAVTAPVINISANATGHAQQVAPAWETPLPVVDESIWAPMLDGPAEPKEDAISSILGDEATVEVTPGAATTPEAPPAAAVTEAAPGKGALKQQAKPASTASKIIPKTRRGWACLGAGIAVGIAATVGLLRRS